MRHLTDTSTDPVLKRTADRRPMALVLAFVAAGCLITAAFSKSWMGNSNFSGIVRDSDGNPSREQGRYMKFRGDIRFGPLGFEHCGKPNRGFEMHETPSEVECRSLSTVEYNDEVGMAAELDRDKYTSEAFARAGWLAFGACLLAAASLIVSALLVLARVKKELPISPASVALLGLVAAMAAGCVFVATKPGPAGMVGVDLGFWAFGAGTVIGLLGAQMLAKDLRPPDPDLLAGAIDPADFAAFRPPPQQQAVPVPMADVPTTQPVEILADGAPVTAVEPPAADSPGGAKKPDDVSS